MRILCTIIALLLALSGIAYNQSIELRNSTLWSDKIDIFVDGDYAYCSSTFGIMILNISNPADPSLVSEIPIEGYVHGMAKFGDFLLASVNGLTVYDISDPYSPVYAGNYFGEFYYGPAAVYGNYAFLSRFSYDEIDYGLDIVDLSNPQEPQLAGTCSTGSGVGAIAFADSMAFYKTSHGFTILDISDPTSPEYISDVHLNDYNFGFAVEYPNAYITYYVYMYWDGGIFTSGGVKIYDISEPENPVFLGVGAQEDWIPFDIAVQSPYAYVTSTRGFKIMDISDPANPSVCGEYSGFGYNRLLAKQGNYCYLAAEDTISIQIVDISEVTEPVLTGNYGYDYYQIYSGQISNNKLYLGTPYGLQIADISDPRLPTLQDFMNMHWYDYNIYDSIAYVTNLVSEDSDLLFYNIADYSNPVLISSRSYNYNGIAHIKVSDDILYACGRLDGLSGDIFFVDISDLSNPIFLGSYNRDSYYTSAYCVDDSVLYCKANLGNLHIVGLNDPRNPVLMSDIDTPGWCSDITVCDSYAYIADGDCGLTVLNISDLYNPAVISQLETGGSFVSLEKVGNVLVGINDDNDYPEPAQVFIIDISDPNNPDMIVSRNVYGSIGDVICKDNYIIICASYGLLIYEYDIETGLNEVSTTPSSYAILQNYPNPFNASTTIEYGLKEESFVTVEIYDLLGREVTSLVNENQRPGFYQIVWDGGNYSSGMYFYRIQAGDFVETKKMILLK